MFLWTLFLIAKEDEQKYFMIISIYFITSFCVLGVFEIKISLNNWR